MRLVASCCPAARVEGIIIHRKAATPPFTSTNVHFPNLERKVRMWIDVDPLSAVKEPPMKVEIAEQSIDVRIRLGHNWNRRSMAHVCFQPSMDCIVFNVRRGTSAFACRMAVIAMLITRLHFLKLAVTLVTHPSITLSYRVDSSQLLRSNIHSLIIQ